ncbi:MAG TPA: hypothetical protein H9805_05690, partial [Candidatus Janibacter merdipullorum]|nr:hypothetical protein [Candidatus Janibacter merdipullorum]
MRPDPRSLPRAARRLTKRTAARISGVEDVRADLTKARADLQETRARHERTKDALRSAREKRDSARERVAELETALREEQTRRREATKRVTAFGYAYRGLRAAALGYRLPSELGPAPGRAPEGEDRTELEQEMAWQHARSLFVRSLADGQGLAGAVEGLIRRAQGSEQVTEVRQISQWLFDHEPTRQAGALATGLVAHRMGLPTFAWERLSTLPDEIWLEHAPSEYVLLAGQHDERLAEQAVRRALDHPGPLSTSTWLTLTRRAMGLGLGDTCTALAERFDDAARADLASGQLTEAETSRLELDRAWMRRWAPRVAMGPATPTPAVPGTVHIGVIGYDQPDPRNTSSNIGDYVQTIASMSHLVRHTGACFDDTPLGRFAQDLAARVPADLRVGSPDVPVSLHQVDRDASTYSQVPEGTWLLAFGWYAHKLGGVRHDFPFPDHLRPLYISFHLNKRALLTDEMIEHLRAHAPIGCRDHSTVDLLLGLGIPAFFSGCLTTTVRYVRPDDAPERPEDAPTVWIDLPAPKGARQVRNERPDVRAADLVDNLRTALASVEDYTSAYGTVVTGRLHAYLPARSLGCTVDFSPRNPSDIRFAGLAPLTADEVFEMGRGIADLLEPVMSAILSGEDEGRVRQLWSEVTADRVAAARRRHEEEVTLPSLVDIDEAVATIRAGQVDSPRTEPGPDGEEMEIVLALDGNLKDQFLVVVDGLVEHASRPIHLNVLVREHEQADFDRAAALFPTVSFTWWPCDDVGYGDIHAMIPHITISTMDRLVLPELLADVERVVYHDIDALPVADIAELYETDLQGSPLAARDSEASTMQSGYTNIFTPAALPGLEPGMGTELIRRETRRHPFDFVGFNAGIMVLDLARMRADRFCERFLPYAH